MPRLLLVLHFCLLVVWNTPSFLVLPAWWKILKSWATPQIGEQTWVPPPSPLDESGVTSPVGWSMRSPTTLLDKQGYPCLLFGWYRSTHTTFWCYHWMKQVYTQTPRWMNHWCQLACARSQYHLRHAPQWLLSFKLFVSSTKIPIL